jgi:hypothetical protein
MTEINSMVPWSMYRGIGEEEEEADADDVDPDIAKKSVLVLCARKGAR